MTSVSPEPAREPSPGNRYFPFHFVRWKLRMMQNMLAERREFVVLSVFSALLGLGGALAWVGFVTRALNQALSSGPVAELSKNLNTILFAALVAFLFMALANVVSGFFSQARMEERERLMGPLSPSALFWTEVIDALRLPLSLLAVGGLLPLWLVTFDGALPVWLAALVSFELTALFSLPSLVVLGGYIALIRGIPTALLGRQFLLFAFFFVNAGLAAAALGELRAAFGNHEGIQFFPASLVAETLSAYKAGNGAEVWRSAGAILGVLTVSVLGAWGSYRFLFLERLELFGVLQTEHEEGRGLAEESGIRRLLMRFLPAPVAAVVHKDLRSSVRDTAQRIAFTALGAVIMALVSVDLLFSRMNADIFLPVFYFYAMFLVACQGLSTFSAEGGVLENLARLPIDADSLVRAKVIGHALLFAAVSIGAALLAALAPSPVPPGFRFPAAAVMMVAMLPFSLLLAHITVCLGAIFPKPGEGGGRKEISIFAMGLFMNLLLLFGVSVTGAIALPILLGPLALAGMVVVLLCWWGALRLLNRLAVRAVERALGAEMRLG